MLNTTVLGAGFALAASLLVAIGAQNAFVLRQGLRREHVLTVVCACTLYDWLLIGGGVGGLGALVRRHPGAGAGLGLGGAAFLFAYGVLAWRRAWRPSTLQAPENGAALSWRAALLQCTAFTFLNPHVYLDTVVLLGSVGAQQAPGTLGSFFLGAASASAAWFAALGYGARLLAPVFSRPIAWRALDGLVGATMFVLAYSLWRHGAGA
jgi:L-lysine exporter family protein LysE/ArgO